MENLIYMVIGAVLGFILREISARLRKKENQTEKHKTLTDSTVADCLKFVFKTRDIIDNVITKKQQYIKLKETNPSRAADLHSKLMSECDDDLKSGFFTELNFRSYQLKRLDNQELWKQFEKIVMVQGELFPMLFKDDPLDKVKKTKDQWSELVKEFNSYCIEISKVKS